MNPQGRDTSLSRSAGVLLHPSSLSGPEGAGTFGAEAIAFLDWLQGAGFTTWQVLPLCQAGEDHSPYSSPASFIGNPLLIDLRTLGSEILLSPEQIATAPKAQDRIDLDALKAWKLPLLREAAATFLKREDHPWKDAYLSYRDSLPWLDPVLLFLALAKRENKNWWEWPQPLRRRDPKAIEEAAQALEPEIDIERVLSFFFDRQWSQLQDAAHERGIHLLGDLPLYVSPNSADVWLHPENFELGENGAPSRVAAVPPDAFSETGQLWGNPLYRWKTLASNGYAWWIQRMNRALQWTPLLRLDHFRGFSAYYGVDSQATTAIDGTWSPGPGAPFFTVLQQAIGERTLIAEDLGDIDEEVHRLRRKTGYLCIRVLQFGFEGDPDALHESDHCPVDSVVYTGTHDNNTTAGWWEGLPPMAQKRVMERLHVPFETRAVVDALVSDALGSPSVLAMLPIQDILRLNGSARMNTPGTLGDNWNWRMTKPLSTLDAERMNALLLANDRRPPKETP